MYELYGVEQATEYATMVNSSQAAGGIIGAACAVACTTVVRAAGTYRAYRFERRLQRVREKLKGWEETPTKKKKGHGSRFQDPKDKGNRVRVDRGKPDHKLRSQRQDHVVEQRQGRTVDKDGNEIKPTEQNPNPSKTEEAHIPLIDWLKKNL